jgi:hypothetical protein
MSIASRINQISRLEAQTQAHPCNPFNHFVGLSVRPNVNWSYAAHNLAMTMLENRAENRNLPTLSLFIRDLMLLLGIWTLMATVSYHYIVDYL